MTKEAVRMDLEIHGGVLVFTRTRTPVKNLFDYLETGKTLDQFLVDFPAVGRSEAVNVLKMARAPPNVSATPA